MALLEVTDQNFDAIIESDQPVLIDFWAPWCGPCRTLGPIVESVALEMDTKMVCGKLDVDLNPNTAAKYGIRSIPTMIIFKDGNVVERMTGVIQKTPLLEKLNRAL
jgi:thioredoxin 1